jgi:glutathione peroxidase
LRPAAALRYPCGATNQRDPKTRQHEHFVVPQFAHLSRRTGGSADERFPFRACRARARAGTPAPLANYKGKVILLVNVASRCGFTPQYTALESIYEKYKDQGFVILGFPANNFGGQEPGTNAEIKTFCQTKYSVTFPIYAKVSVKGDDQTPLYQYLTTTANPSLAGDIKWNFTKFLVSRDGKVVQRFESPVKPDSPEVTSAIEEQLKQK